MTQPTEHGSHNPRSELYNTAVGRDTIRMWSLLLWMNLRNLHKSRIDLHIYSQASARSLVSQAPLCTTEAAHWVGRREI